MKLWRLGPSSTTAPTSPCPSAINRSLSLLSPSSPPHLPPPRAPRSADAPDSLLLNSSPSSVLCPLGSLKWKVTSSRNPYVVLPSRNRVGVPAACCRGTQLPGTLPITVYHNCLCNRQPSLQTGCPTRVEDKVPHSPSTPLRLYHAHNGCSGNIC